MAIEEALTALLSGVAGGRVHWGWAEGLSPADGPYARLTWISGVHDYAMSGPTGYIQRRLQMDIFGETFSAVRKVAQDAKSALSGVRGTIGGVKIGGIFIDNESSGDASDPGKVSFLHRHRIDLMVHYSE